MKYFFFKLPRKRTDTRSQGVKVPRPLFTFSQGEGEWNYKENERCRMSEERKEGDRTPPRSCGRGGEVLLRGTWERDSDTR
jgi:hypothetical protein